MTTSLGSRSAATPAGSTLTSKPALNIVITIAAWPAPPPIAMTCHTKATDQSPLPSRVVDNPSVSSR